MPSPQHEQPAGGSDRLDRLYDEYVDRRLADSRAWYDRKRGRKKRLGLGIRIVAIIAAGVGVLVPIIASLVVDEHGAPRIQPGWASVAILVGAGLVWIDRFLGGTSGWIRYMVTLLEVERLRDQARIRWTMLRAAREGDEPNVEQVREALEFVRQLNDEATGLVREETESWAREFRDSLAEFDTVLRSRARTLAPDAPGTAAAAAPTEGGLTVIVSNADEIVGCTVTVDPDTTAAVERSCPADRVAFVGVRPGPRRIVARGTIEGTDASGEAAAIVAAGSVVEVPITLVRHRNG